MEREIMDKNQECMCEAIKNVKSDVKIDLSGWPATIAIGFVCLAGVAVCGIRSYTHLQQVKMA